MKFLSFLHGDLPAFGVLHDDERVSELSAIDPHYRSLKEAISRLGTQRLLELGRRVEPHLALADVRLLPPIPRPGKIICIGLNYRAHALEGGFKVPEFPSTFIRMCDTLVASDAPIVLPPSSISTHLDFEGELAVIIGKTGRHIAHSSALDHVFGYSCFNDGSLRDFQFKHSLASGKNFPSTGGFGPFIETSDVITNPSTLTLSTRLNGTQVQHQTLEDMIFDVPSIIEYVSRWTPLSPGDVIATGTPAGVGFARTPPLWLREGDIVEVEISSIGTLRNTVCAS